MKRNEEHVYNGPEPQKIKDPNDTKYFYTFYEGFNIGSNLSSHELSQAESWGVGDKNGNLLLGVNNKKLSTAYSIIFTSLKENEIIKNIAK